MSEARRRLGFAALCFGLAAASCASYTALSADQQARILRARTGRSVELRQSSFYGDLYEENELWLLSPLPFAHTSHLVDPTGRPMHPPRQRGILPAGTPLVVERIEFPTGWAMARRLLATPRFNPWVVLRPQTPGAGGLPQQSRPLIWVLPDRLNSPEAVEAALDAALAPAGEVSNWLATLRPTVQVGIRHKEPLMEMRGAELTAALGLPVRELTGELAGKPARVAWYPTHEVWLVDDEVRALHEPRALPQLP